MGKALRPYLTAGVAVVGAGALAIAPVIATPPDVRIVNPAVQQSAGPLDSYVATVREALENLEALLGSALALPAPTGWTLGLALDNLLTDPGNVALFVDELGALGPLAGASVPALLKNAADAIEATVEQAAAGDFDLAIVSLIRTYIALAPAVTAIVGVPLKLLGPELAGTASVVLAKSFTAAVGPVLSGLAGTGVAIQNVVNALDDAKPGSGALLGALIAAPGSVLDGVVSGFSSAPGQIALPGILTPGDPFDPSKPNPGPVALAAGVARGFGSALMPPPVGAAAATSGGDRFVTLAVDGQSTPVADEERDSQDLRDPDDGTNENVAASHDDAVLSGVPQHGPRVFGENAANRSVGGTGLTTVRQGIRDGIRELRNGVRDAVKSVTGGDRTPAGGSAPAGDEPAGP
ncbi:MAG TPA: hypothetical protein VJR50_06035 [Mycobacterium sp.]|nr:hypothetical protein [Mycobacterium sp.]